MPESCSRAFHLECAPLTLDKRWAAPCFANQSGGYLELLYGSLDGDDTASSFQPPELLEASSACKADAVATFLDEQGRWREQLLATTVNRPGRVAIVGAGVIGLSVALELAPLGYEITIFHDRPLLETTSTIAAGLIEPVAPPEAPDARQVVLDAFGYSFRSFAATVRSQPREVVMLRRITGYRREAVEPPDWADVVDAYHLIDGRELPSPFGWGETFISFVVDPRAWVSWRAAQLTTAGVEFVHRHLESPTALVGDFDVIVNATGLYAADFVSDTGLYRTNGHVLTVPRPLDFHEAIFDWDYPHDVVVFRYAIARAHEVVLGGTLEDVPYDAGEPALEEEIAQTIYDSVGELVPALADLPIETYKACSRPSRAAPRLGVERIGNTVLVHCYGTGGSGWTLGPGLARFAVELLVAEVPPPTTPA